MALLYVHSLTNPFGLQIDVRAKIRARSNGAINGHDEKEQQSDHDTATSNFEKSYNISWFWQLGRVRNEIYVKVKTFNDSFALHPDDDDPTRNSKEQFDEDVETKKKNYKNLLRSNEENIYRIIEDPGNLKTE